jgi:hypothetical protein
MSQPAQKTLPKDKFLVIAVNLLHRLFLEAGRPEAKRLYRGIRDGKVASLTRLRMEDDSILQFQLSMDHSELGGHPGFGAFRGGLEVLLGNINRALQDKQDINVFSSQESPDSMLFGITGVTVERDQTSVMVLGADVSGPTGVVTLRLLYLDPAQFAAREEAGEGELSGTVNV